MFLLGASMFGLLLFGPLTVDIDLAPMRLDIPLRHNLRHTVQLLLYVGNLWHFDQCYRHEFR